jgi:hypothetical protein
MVMFFPPLFVTLPEKYGKKNARCQGNNNCRNKVHGNKGNNADDDHPLKDIPKKTSNEYGKEHFPKWQREPRGGKRINIREVQKSKNNERERFSTRSYPFFDQRRGFFHPFFESRRRKTFFRIFAKSIADQNIYNDRHEPNAVDDPYIDVGMVRHKEYRGAGREFLSQEHNSNKKPEQHLFWINNTIN